MLTGARGRDDSRSRLCAPSHPAIADPACPASPGCGLWYIWMIGPWSRFCARGNVPLRRMVRPGCSPQRVEQGVPPARLCARNGRPSPRRLVRQAPAPPRGIYSRAVHAAVSAHCVAPLRRMAAVPPCASLYPTPPSALPAHGFCHDAPGPDGTASAGPMLSGVSVPHARAASAGVVPGAEGIGRPGIRPWRQVPAASLSRRQITTPWPTFGSLFRLGFMFCTSLTGTR